MKTEKNKSQTDLEQFIAAHDPKKTRYEYPDPQPLAPAVGFKRAPSIFEQHRELIRSVKLAELENLQETEDDADDFETPDDPDSLPGTPWENDTTPSLKSVKERSAALTKKLKSEGWKVDETTGELVEPQPKPPSPKEKKPGDKPAE